MRKTILQDRNFIFGIEDLFPIDDKAFWKSFFVHTRENSNAERYDIHIHLIASVFEDDDRNRVSGLKINSGGFEDGFGISILEYIETLKKAVLFADKIVNYFASRGEVITFNKTPEKYGDFLRRLRINFRETMGDTAKMLNVSLPKLSAVENGKQEVPDGWANIIIKHYHLFDTEGKALMAIIAKHNEDVRYIREVELWR